MHTHAFMWPYGSKRCCRCQVCYCLACGERCCQLFRLFVCIPAGHLYVYMGPLATLLKGNLLSSLFLRDRPESPVNSVLFEPSRGVRSQGCRGAVCPEPGFRLDIYCIYGATGPFAVGHLASQLIFERPNPNPQLILASLSLPGAYVLKDAGGRPARNRVSGWTFTCIYIWTIGPFAPLL